MASFTYTPHPPVAGDTIQFTDTSTNVGTITGWSWNFGDGTTSNLPHPTKQYTTAGTRMVTLTVTDDHGATANFSRNITIGFRDNFVNTAGWSMDEIISLGDGESGWSSVTRPGNPGGSLYNSVDPPLGWGSGTEIESVRWTRSIGSIGPGPLSVSACLKLTGESEGYTVSSRVWDAGEWRTIAMRHSTHGDSTEGFDWSPVSGTYTVTGSVDAIRIYMHLEDWGRDRKGHHTPFESN